MCPSANTKHTSIQEDGWATHPQAKAAKDFGPVCGALPAVATTGVGSSPGQGHICDGLDALE